MTAAPLSPDAVRVRHVRRADMVACTVAFIDCRMPGQREKVTWAREIVAAALQAAE